MVNVLKNTLKSSASLSNEVTVSVAKYIIIESSLFSEVGLVVLVPQPITNTIKIIIVLFMVLS